MGTISVNIAHPTLAKVYEFEDGTCVVDLRCEKQPVSISGPTLMLRELFGCVLDALDDISRSQSMRQHPSMFNPDKPIDLFPCEGSFMPDGSIYLTPAQAEAVAQINEAIDQLNEDTGIVSSAMFRDRENQANELGGDAA